MNLGKLFDEVSKKMNNDMNETRKAIDKHAGIKGASFEEIFRTFLRKYLPKAFDISTGFIVDSNGKQSRQLDVIISDAMRTPVFYEKGETRIFPVECVYAVIEVKAKLEASDLDGILENMLSVRRLTKKAYRSEPSYNPAFTAFPIYGKEDWEGYPINYFVFAFDSSDLKSLASILNEKHKERKLPLWSRIDGICVGRKGMITNIVNQPNLGIFYPLPQPNSQLVAEKAKRPLLWFYEMLMDCLSVAELHNFSLIQYMPRSV